jgi:hypothetical protein
MGLQSIAWPAGRMGWFSGESGHELPAGGEGSAAR